MYASDIPILNRRVHTSGNAFYYLMIRKVILKILVICE